MTHRASGRTAQYADLSVHEPKSPVDEQTPFAYSMEGANGTQPGALIPYVWSPGWNSNQSVFKFQQEVGGPLQGGDGGVRLIQPNGAEVNDALADQFRKPPNFAAQPGGHLRLTPRHPYSAPRSFPPMRRRLPNAAALRRFCCTQMTPPP